MSAPAFPLQAPQQLQSICILRLSAIGDVCHAVSVVQAIQQYYPQAKISWIIGKVEAMLLKDLPGVELIVFDKKLGLGAYTDLRNKLRGQQFDVLLQNHIHNCGHWCGVADHDLHDPAVRLADNA